MDNTPVNFLIRVNRTKMLIKHMFSLRRSHLAFNLTTGNINVGAVEPAKLISRVGKVIMINLYYVHFS